MPETTLPTDYYGLLAGYAGLALLGGLASRADPPAPTAGDRTWDSLLFGAATVYTLVCCGLRDVTVGIDTPSYLQYYALIAPESGFAVTGRVRVEWLFFVLVKLISATVANERFYLLVVHLLFLIPFRFFLTKLDRPNRGLYFLLYVSCFFYYSLTLNVIRHAVAIGLALPAIWFFYQKRYGYTIILLLIAVQFHFTALLMVGCLLVIWLFPRVETYVVPLFLLAVVVVMLGFSPTSLLRYTGFSSLLQAKLSGYGTRLSQYQTGFRFDFCLFNGLFLWVGVQARKYVGGSFYSFAVTLYGLLGSVFVLAFPLPYSDRVGLWSWMLVPIIVGYPVLHRQPKQTGWLVIGAGLAAIISLYMTRVHYLN